jgi:heme exporter protein D
MGDNGAMTWLVIAGVVVAAMVAVAIHDVVQRRHSILRNFPIISPRNRHLLRFRHRREL